MRRLAWLPLAAALLLALGALALTAFAALYAPHPGIPASEPPAGNLLGAARSYLFRQALRNTLLVAALVFALTFAATLLRLRKVPAARRAWSAWDALAAAPLFLPAPATALLWRPLFDHIDLANRPDLALALVALVFAWRLLPLSFLVERMAEHASAPRAAIVTGLAALWLTLLDAGTLLLLTGGQPFNATHVWASWAFHTVWVSRLWGHGAVMLGGLAAAGVLIAGLLHYLVTHPPGRITPAASPAPRVRLAPYLGAALALAPLTLHAPHLQLAAPGASLAGLNAPRLLPLARQHGIRVAARLAHRRSHRRGRSMRACRCRDLLAWTAVVVGAAAYPLWPYVATQFPGLAQNVDSRLILAGAAGISAGLIAYGLAGARQASRYTVLCMTALAAALLTLNQTSAQIVLEGGRRAYPLAAGMALYLAEAPTLAGERVWSLLLTLGLAWLRGRRCPARAARRRPAEMTPIAMRHAPFLRNAPRLLECAALMSPAA